MIVGTNTIAGEFTRLDYPKSLEPGKDIEIKVDGNLVDLTKSWVDFWQGCFTIEGAGRKDADRFSGSGTVIGPEWAPTLRLGAMPSASVTITVKIWANNSLWAEWDWDAISEMGWEQIVSRTITIKSTEAAEIPWSWIALGGGAIIAAVIVSQMARRKK